MIIKCNLTKNKVSRYLPVFITNRFISNGKTLFGYYLFCSFLQINMLVTSKLSYNMQNQYRLKLKHSSVKYKVQNINAAIKKNANDFACYFYFSSEFITCTLNQMRLCKLFRSLLLLSLGTKLYLCVKTQ